MPLLFGPSASVDYVRSSGVHENTWWERLRATGTANFQKCPVLPSSGSHHSTRRGASPLPRTYPSEAIGSAFLSRTDDDAIVSGAFARIQSHVGHAQESVGVRAAIRKQRDARRSRDLARPKKTHRMVCFPVLRQQARKILGATLWVVQQREESLR